MVVLATARPTFAVGPAMAARRLKLMGELAPNVALIKIRIARARHERTGIRHSAACLPHPAVEATACHQTGKQASATPPHTPLMPGLGPPRLVAGWARAGSDGLSGLTVFVDRSAPVGCTDLRLGVCFRQSPSSSRFARHSAGQMRRGQSGPIRPSPSKANCTFRRGLGPCGYGRLGDGTSSQP